MGQVAIGCPFHPRTGVNIGVPLLKRDTVAFRNEFRVWCPSCGALGPRRYDEAKALAEWNALVPPENLNDKLETFRITNDPERN
jgi:hypothetical protein